MKRRPHKVISVLLLAALIAGMGMACRERSLEIRNKRWEENAETVTQNSGRIFGDEPENLYARSAVLIDADSGRVLFEKEADEIDMLTYNLYGLSYDEILIVDPDTKITRDQYDNL